MSFTVALNFADGASSFIQVKPGELLLDAALRQGISLPLDCREGVCGTCQGQCESGRYEQDYVDDEALSPRDLAERKVLACQTRVQSDASFYFDHAASLCHAAGPLRVSARVLAVEQVSASTAILHLCAGQHPQPLQYLPGQYARLKVPGSEQWRAYSFANLPNPGNRLQFLIRLLPDGAMSNYLRDGCQPGQLIELEAPMGSFYLREVRRPLVLVAGGTGLSAFLGMLDAMAERGGCGQPVRLFYGVNQEDDLCEQARLEGYKARIPGFDYTPVVSRPGDAWRGRAGYIPDHLDAQALAAQAFDMYLCGPPPMIEAVRGWLAGQALAEHQLYSEKFLQSGR
ncbi:anthranilate 1,2-dioxygenase electron transfer component AntC [Pseudomonas sp. NPDC007930]|uniref:anthranilate 1,2-dioxygenase electron transfer component AntC n=1 Tax=Pseudomonas sp. NPDC007930 TaxID=3364417 RepID=UPI0036ECFAFC